MATPSVTIPSRVSIERAAGVSRETLPHGQLTRAAASEPTRWRTPLSFHALAHQSPAGSAAIACAAMHGGGTDGCACVAQPS